MFSRIRNVSTRTLLTSAAVALVSLCLVGSAQAANTGPTPELAPALAQLVAGSPALLLSGANSGFGGEGAQGGAATLNGPNVLTVDSAGNVYVSDNGNAIIREVNAQNGTITTVAGKTPSGCVGTASCHANVGCADGVPAQGAPIGNAIQGLAVDAYGNLFFNDGATNSVSVVYRGGAQVAAFIALENPTGVAKSGGVQAGYVYHVAGSINLATCVGTASKAATATAAAIPINDGELAYNGGGAAVTVTFTNVGPMALDSAGNLFIGDSNVVRVINTHAVPQTYLAASTVQPGFIQSILNCSTSTTSCPPGFGAYPITQANSGEAGPAAGGVFNSIGTGNGAWMSVDAYGNIYELNTKGATPILGLAVAYAGGSPLGNLITQANIAFLANNTSVTPPLAVTVGDFYYLVDSITLRPSSSSIDSIGNIYYLDNHYSNIYRFDVNARSTPSSLLEYSSILYGGTSSKNRLSPATSKLPVFCYSVGSGLAPSTSNPTLTGYQTSDPYGDGCPASLANGAGSPASGNGYGSLVNDGPGNILFTDRTNNLLRKVSLGNVFPVTPIGQQLNPTTLAGEQTLQVHFDQLNLPNQSTPSPSVTTNAFAIAPGISDFTINPIQSTYTTTAAPAAVGGLPQCSNLTGSNDSSLDCSVNVIFSPTLPGLRQSQLVVTTANGSVYTLGLSGIGTGGQLAVDGGAAVAVPATGLGNIGQVAVTQSGTTYIADPANNRIVVIPGSTTLTGVTTTASTTVTTTSTAGFAVGEPITGPGIPAGTTIAAYASGVLTLSANATATATVTLTAGGGSQTTVGTGLSHPMGVAVDGFGNVYIADTGNNRVLEVSQATGAQTVMGAILATGTPAYTPYAFKSPQSVAVDLNGNVYVADTGNASVVEIPSNTVLGGATPLLQYPGAPTFKNPVSVAVDALGNVYVADTSKIAIVIIPPGGGDLAKVPGTSLPFAGNALQPSGVAVDAAGNVYISSIQSGTGSYLVSLAGSATGAAGAQFNLNLPGLNLAGNSGTAAFQGGSLALDSNGNLFVADSGNSRLLFVNRQNPTIPFGVVAQDATVTPQTLTVTNVGNQAVPLVGPSLPAGTTGFTLPANTCMGTLAVGTHCTFAANFLPTSDGAQSAAVSVNGASQTVILTGTGEQPMVTIALSVTAPAGGAVMGQPATVTATVTQPNIAGDTPTGTVTFNYLIQGDNISGTMTSPLAGSGGTARATLTLPTLLQGRRYTINATYNSDAQNSLTMLSSPLVIQIPGVPVTVVANSVTYTYGQPVPAFTCTITGIIDPTVTGKCSSLASSTSTVGTYPIIVTFSGGTYLNYGFPTVVTPSGAPATVTETQAALTVKANNATAPYGSQPISFTSTVTGLVGSDQVLETYTPPDSSILNVGTYAIVPTIGSPSAVNYMPTVTNGTLIVTTAPSTIVLSSVTASVLSSNLAGDPITITVGTAVAGGKGTPTGQVTLTDTFTPIISGPPGSSATLAPVTIGPISLVGGLATYIPTSTALGTHVYTANYGGDMNFTGSTTLNGLSIIVDVADFTVSLPSSPIVIAPGVIPGGSGVAGGSSSAVEQATISVTSILSYTGTVFLGCVPQSPSYTSCSIVSPAVTVVKPTTGTSSTIQAILSVQTPATLPLNFNFNVAGLRHSASETALAFLPLGVLVFCFRKKRRLGTVLWMFSALAVLCTGLNGCGGGNLVHFYTPIPSGSQTLAVYACTVQSSCPSVSITGSITGGSASVTGLSSTTGLTVGGNLVSPIIGFTGDTTSGSSTLMNIPSTIGVSSGVAISGAGIPAGTTITAVTAPTATAGGTVTLSAPATASGLSTAVMANSPVAPGTTIVAIGAGTLTLSAPVTGTGTVGLTAATTSTGQTRAFTVTTSFE